MEPVIKFVSLNIQSQDWK
jgi:HEAT repeat